MENKGDKPNEDQIGKRKKLVDQHDCSRCHANGSCFLQLLLSELDLLIEPGGPVESIPDIIKEASTTFAKGIIQYIVRSDGPEEFEELLEREFFSALVMGFAMSRKYPEMLAMEPIVRKEQERSRGSSIKDLLSRFNVVSIGKDGIKTGGSALDELLNSLRGRPNNRGKSN